MNVVTLKRQHSFDGFVPILISVGRVFGCSLPAYERTPFHWAPNISTSNCRKHRNTALDCMAEIWPNGVFTFLNHFPFPTMGNLIIWML